MFKLSVGKDRNRGQETENLIFLYVIGTKYPRALVVLFFLSFFLNTDAPVAYGSSQTRG